MKTIKIFRYLDDVDCFVTGIQPGAARFMPDEHVHVLESWIAALRTDR